MPADGFDVAVTSADDGHLLRLTGELDMATAHKLRDQLTSLADDGARHVTVDLSDLEFIDSTGLSVLVTGLKRLREQGGDLALRSPRPSTRKILEITGLTEVFPIS
jgi:anti-sigma B factor antagonist